MDAEPECCLCTAFENLSDGRPNLEACLGAFMVGVVAGIVSTRTDTPVRRMLCALHVEIVRAAAGQCESESCLLEAFGLAQHVAGVT